MALIDQHVLWTFFASLLGFVLLYTLRRNSSKRTTNKKNFPEECAEESFADGECRPVNGSGTDVIIVGAGVAGSALAYTLGKVKFSC
jgi:squalene monooxygenase